MRLFRFICLFVIMISGLTTFAQQISPEMKAANNLLKDKKYDEAINAYKMILKQEPNNGMAWYYIANAEYSQKSYNEAITAYLNASKTLTGPIVCYNLAGVYALSGDKENAYKWLEKAVEKGFKQYRTMQKDSDFESLRKDERFNNMVEKVKKKNDPCLSREEFSQFNFWIGKWDVVTATGQPAGDSEINLMNNGCTIVENWYGKSGSVGKSFNYFDIKDNKWHQFWINQNAQKTTFEGELEDGNMVFYSYDHVKDEKNPYLERLTFFNLGKNKVRQYDQKTTDNGKTWTVQYDLTYNRKTNSK